MGRNMAAQIASFLHRMEMAMGFTWYVCSHLGIVFMGLLKSLNYHVFLKFLFLVFHISSFMYFRALLTKVLGMVWVQLHWEDLISLARLVVEIWVITVRLEKWLTCFF